MMNRNELVKLLKQILVKDLKNFILFLTPNTIYFNIIKMKKGSLENIEKKLLTTLKTKNRFLGIKPQGDFYFRYQKG